MDTLLAIQWVPFVAVMTLAYIVPGPDFLVILRSAAHGARRGLMAAVGAQTGLAVHMLLAAAGLSVILSRHPEVLDAIRVLGGLYLAHLGIGLIRSDGHDDSTAGRAGSPFIAGLLTNLLNPKAILFFASVLPQFVSPGHSVVVQVLVLGVADVLFGFLPWLVVILLGSRLSGVLADARRRRAWDRVTGGLLTLVGGWLAVTGLRSLVQRVA